MAKLVEFDLGPKSGPVWINSDHVVAVQRYRGGEEASVITLSVRLKESPKYFSVLGSIDEVAAKLNR